MSKATGLILFFLLVSTFSFAFSRAFPPQNKEIPTRCDSLPTLIKLTFLRLESKLCRKYVSNFLNEPQYLAKVKTPKRLKIPNKGVTNLRERKLKTTN